MRSSDAIVVGGGVIGCAVAYRLAREGLAVALYERDEIAAHASGAAAGMLAPIVEAEVEDPLRRWGVRSLERFPALVAELEERSGVDPEYFRSGILRVATSSREAEQLRARANQGAAWDLEWLDADAARAAEPQLAPDLFGAVWSPREAHVRSPRLTLAYARSASQLGARIEVGALVTDLCREGGRVTGVRTPAGTHRAAWVVLCTGCWARASAGWLGGFEPPIEPVRGQIVSVDAPSPPLASILWSGETYLVPKRDGGVVVGATEEHVGFDCRVTVEGVQGLLAAARRLAPSLGGASFRGAWAGLRPATPDRHPLIGPVPGIEGVIVAAGHHRSGVLFSPITAELVADLVLGKGFPEDARAFLPERFASRSTN